MFLRQTTFDQAHDSSRALEPPCLALGRFFFAHTLAGRVSRLDRRHLTPSFMGRGFGAVCFSHLPGRPISMAIERSSVLNGENSFVPENSLSKATRHPHLSAGLAHQRSTGPADLIFGPAGSGRASQGTACVSIFSRLGMQTEKPVSSCWPAAILGFPRTADGICHLAATLGASCLSFAKNPSQKVTKK